MKSKRWVVLFFIILFTGLAGFMALNYYANPMGYFNNEKGRYDYWNEDYERSIKTRYVLAHKDEIQALILGGSKSGAIDTKLMTELSGLNYYNMCMNFGNYADYLRYIRFFIANTDIQEITLHISSYEVQRYDVRGSGDAYKTPAVLSGNPLKEGVEFLSFLMTDVSTTISTLQDRAKRDTSYAYSLENGQWNMKRLIANFKSNPDNFVEKNVLNDAEKHLHDLFLNNTNDENEKMKEVRLKGVEDLRQIRQICDENGVRLRVVIGPSFLTERINYECDEYYSFLRQMVTIMGEVWDFSDYCDINMNPYNFRNWRHCFPSTSAVMMNTVYGKEKREGFGTILTPDNIDRYLVNRKKKYNALRREYLMSGKVELQGMDDESYIPLEDIES